MDMGLEIHKKRNSDIVAALAGNPNVGKSTVFNAMTGMRQHTGNWAGKTVASAQGYACYKGQGYVLVDIPGCYSLDAHSAEEEVARDFLCSGEFDVAVVVCAQNVDLIVILGELVPGIGYVGGKVGVLAVGLDHYAVFVITKVSGAEP